MSTERKAELNIELQDGEWPFTYTDHDRLVVRAVVYDDEDWYYFLRAVRDDDFGKSTLIETSGGGVEDGEDLTEALLRELKEELGIEAEPVVKIGVVSDYYNLIHRHNINHYYLCRARSFGEKHLTEDEIKKFHLSTLRLKFDDAVREYEKRRDSKLGRLIASRELPVLQKARELITESKRKYNGGGGIRMNFKYVRIQGQELAANTMYAKGIFSMCWQLIQNDIMDEEDAGLYREIDSWFSENLPWPPQCKNQERVVCFFKTENSAEMMKMIRPALWLLERYHHPYYLVYTNTPGEIVYEDQYQVAVKVPGILQIEDVQPSWSPEDE